MVTHLPTKVVYTVGEALDISGIEVTGMYTGGRSKMETVTLSNISGYNPNTVGQQTVTVTVNGRTAIFTVTVNTGAGGEATLQRIAITSPPTKTVYAPGAALNLSGLEVTGTYSDGTTKPESVSLSNISGYDAETMGAQTVTVTLGGKTATSTVSVNVILQNMTELTKASGGIIAASPVALRLKLNLTTSEWKNLLAGIAVVGKYVSLDLSACTMSGTAFDPGTDVNADKVAALVLPDAAKSIRAGTKDKSTFEAFTALRSLSGVGVETIGDWAFTDYCTSLTSVNLPVATSIGDSAFQGCASLESVSLPAATSIDQYAFYNCTSLTSVSLPAMPPAISTGYFYGIFQSTGSSGAITVRVPAGAVSAYTSTWGVSASTSANGNYVYGTDHKAVLITDAAQ
ncbi:MAG: bacterial Ig-like domain-containing protein [Treponema sp.]|nr:bacterial Ig-like domain-containing protein [Treponema sp.]